MKKLITLSLAIIMICSTFVGCDWKSIFQKDKEDDHPQIKHSEGLEFILSNDGESYWLKGIGSCTDTKIVIPDTYNGLPVTYICDETFINQTTITSIIMPDSITGMGLRAFQNCTSLTEVVLSNSVKYLAQRAFAGCSSLTTITIPSSVNTIHDYVFADCTSLQNIIFEDHLIWSYLEMQYDAIYDQFRVAYIPINEDFSNPQTAAQLLTSTYVDDMLQKIKN